MPRRKVPTRRSGRALNAAELGLSGRTAEDLARCVVMLTREVAETLRIDGEDCEVWLKPGRGRRPFPKLVRHLGTGFLVAAKTAAYLVTAAHVARRMDREARMAFGRAPGATVSLRLADLLSLGPRNVRWSRLGHADVAAVRIARPPRALRGRFLPAELLRGVGAAPARGLELVVMGFPLGLGGGKALVPIAKRAHAASEVVRFKGEEMDGPADFFFLDHPTTGGYSGGPVFVTPQVEVTGPGQVATVGPRCVGLVSQTVSDETGAQFAAVAPSTAIRRTLARARG